MRKNSKPVACSPKALILYSGPLSENAEAEMPMKTDLLLLTLLYAVSLAAFIGAINARGRTHKFVSVLLAILCLCGAVFNTTRYFARPFATPSPFLALSPLIDNTSPQANKDSSGFSGVMPTADSSLQISIDSSIAAPQTENRVTETAVTPSLSTAEEPTKPKSAPPAETNTVAVPAKPARAVSTNPKIGLSLETPKQVVLPAKPEIESTTGKSNNTAFLEASKIRLKSELESAKRLVLNYSSLNLGYSSQISDGEYDALASKTTALLNDTRKMKDRLNALTYQLPSELGKAWGILATGEAFLITAGVNAEHFFKAEKEDEEKHRLDAFHEEIESASIALRDAGEALDSVKTVK
jgi:hypothetical protein